MKSIQIIPFAVPNLLNIFRQFMYVLVFYVFIFQPPLIDKNLYVAVQFLIIFFYAIFINKNFFVNFLKLFGRESYILTLIIGFCLIRDLFKGEEVYVLRFIAWSFQTFVFGYFLIEVINRVNIKANRIKIDIFSTLYNSAFVAGCITLILILFPTIDQLYKGIQLDEYYNIYADFEVRYRAYGIAENLTFTYSYVLGFFAGYTLLVLKNRGLLIIPFWIFLIGILYNARIGFFAIILFTVYVSFMKKDIKSLLIFLSMTLLLFFVVSLSNNEFVTSILQNSDWALQFFYDLSDAVFGTNFSGSASSTVDTLTGDYIILPESFSEWIFGTGVSLFEMPLGQNSDVGFIIQLYYGGLFLLFLLVILVLFMCNRLLKIPESRWYLFIFIFSILILNFKGFIFAATPGGRLLFFLYIFFIIKYKYKEHYII